MRGPARDPRNRAVTRRLQQLAAMRAAGCVRIIERKGCLLGWKRWSWFRGVLYATCVQVLRDRA